MSYTAFIKAQVAILEVLRRGGGGGLQCIWFKGERRDTSKARHEERYGKSAKKSGSRDAPRACLHSCSIFFQAKMKQLTQNLKTAAVYELGLYTRNIMIASTKANFHTMKYFTRGIYLPSWKLFWIMKQAKIIRRKNILVFLLVSHFISRSS